MHRKWRGWRLKKRFPTSWLPCLCSVPASNHQRSDRSVEDKHQCICIHSCRRRETPHRSQIWSRKNSFVISKSHNMNNRERFDTISGAVAHLCLIQFELFDNYYYFFVVSEPFPFHLKVLPPAGWELRPGCRRSLRRQRPMSFWRRGNGNTNEVCGERKGGMDEGGGQSRNWERKET